MRIGNKYKRHEKERHCDAGVVVIVCLRILLEVRIAAGALQFQCLWINTPCDVIVVSVNVACMFGIHHIEET